MVKLLREGEEKTTECMPCHTHTHVSRCACRYGRSNRLGSSLSTRAISARLFNRYEEITAGTIDFRCRTLFPMKCF